MYQGLVWLCLIALCLRYGSCYVTSDVEYFHTEVDIAKTSCKVKDLKLAPFENTIQCFPEPGVERPDVIDNGVICIISQDVKIDHAPNRNELALRQCVHGSWTTTSLGPMKSEHKRFFWIVAAAIGGAVVGGLVACAIFCKGAGAVQVPVYPPTFKNTPCRPSDLQETYYVESGQTTTSVTWTKPEATDTSLSAEQVSGPGAGTKFEGASGSGRTYYITYKVTDDNNLSSTCYFSFVVIIKTCSVAQWPTDGQRSCDLDDKLGSVCTYSCNSGYELSGSSQVTCEERSTTPDWTSRPTCEKVKCSQVPSLDNVEVLCSSPDYEYQSTCGFSCPTNYVLSGITSVQCKSDRSWSSTQWPTCSDAVPPSLTCLTPQTFYADRSLSSTSVEWIRPNVTDLVDDNLTPTQTDGQEYGSVFEAGSSLIKYTATDNEGNESPECTIEIRVLETTCQHPVDTIGDDNMRFECGNTVTYTYGTECTLTCDYNIPQVGTDQITCERTDTDLTSGYWSWGDGVMPFCNKTDCPTPDVPENGALIVGYIHVIKVVTMMCNEYFDIPSVSSAFTGQLTCQNSGIYSPNIDIPDCSEVRYPRFSRLPSQLYYTGDCTDASTKDQILSNFQEFLATTINPVIQELCPDVNNCTTSNPEILCYETSRRKKKDIADHDIHKRETAEMIVKFDVEAFFDLELDTIPAIIANDELFGETIVPWMNQLVADGSFDIPSFTIESETIVTQESDAGCDDGFVLSSQFTCLSCPAAYFHNTTSDLCELCPIGYYSDVAALTSCNVCPSGYTTLKTGSKQESQCLEMCPAGRYSTTGTVPCTYCPIGSYQSGTGQTSCTKCITGTTELTGTVSSTACQAFNLLVDGTFGDVTSGSVPADMIDIILTFWVQLYNSGTGNVNIRLLSGGNERIAIHLTDTTRVIIPGTSFNKTIGTLSKESWSHITVQLDTTNNNVIVFRNGIMHSSESYETDLPSPVVSSGTLEILSTGNAGVYIADLHIEDDVLSSSEISSFTSSCWTERPSEVFGMDDLRDTPLQGVKLQTPLSCDPIDECDANPCHDHTCVNGINTYTCYCLGGWSGTNCTTPPNYCADNGCGNGATCVNGDPGYTCSCLPNYSGDFCDIEQVDGDWSEWSEWPSCPVTCGGSTQTRTRSCDNPFPSTNGAQCVGDETETKDCNTETCPECTTFQRVYKSNDNCTHDDSTGLTTCTLTCEAGYVFPDGYENIVYTCGISTDYEWSPIANSVSCQKANAPSQLSIETTTSYDSTVAESDEHAIKEAVIENLKQTSCAGNCNISVELVQSKRKRSTGFTIAVTMTVDLVETGDLDIEGYIQTGTASTSFQELIDAINNLESSASYINTSSSSIFDVTVNGVTYTSSQSTLTITGNVTCPSGQAATDGVCASCPEGTYYTDGVCAFCGRGTYSSSVGQTSCTACPSGFTTTTIGADNVTQCNVEDQTTTALAATTTLTQQTTISGNIEASNNREENSSGTDNIGMYIGIVIAVIALVVSLGVCGFLLYKKNAWRNRRRVSSARPVYHVREQSTVSVTDVNYLHNLPDFEKTAETAPTGANVGNMPYNERYHRPTSAAFMNPAYGTGDWRASASPPPPYVEKEIITVKE